MNDNDLIRRGEVQRRLDLLTAIMIGAGYADFAARSRQAFLGILNDIPAATPTLADALALPEVRALVEAVMTEFRLRDEYEATPTDRGGAFGKKGRANNAWRCARADLAAALAPFKGGA